ncbi:hypothetical protein RND81_10G026700 [Saponaria officinalis]|uniref:Lysine-specific demethylase JMJ25 n=1 Tax=Saponaria officinalis TaxID=3572 RepID=A0AAW1HZU0_SAPOF
MMERESEPLPPDEVRCKRTDGRGWRCKHRALDGKTHCETHINRSSQKKTLKIRDVPGSAADESATRKPTPRIRFRVRVKPDPEDDDVDDTPVRKPVAEIATEVGQLGCDASFAMLALPAVAPKGVTVARAAGVGPTVSPAAGRGPRTKRPSVVGDAEERENGGGDGNVAEKRGPWAKTPSVVADVVEKENGHGDSGAVEAVLEKRGPRTKRPMISDVAERENGGGDNVALGLVEVTKADVPEKRGPRTKRPSVVNDVEGRENEKAVVVGFVRCKRDSGKGWRCERAAKEGFTRCELHLSKASEKSKARVVKKTGLAEKGQNKPKKKRKKSEVVKAGGSGDGGVGEVVVKKEVESEKEEEVGNQLAMVADLAVAEAEGRGMEDEKEWRCKRTDGRRWRCKKRVLDGKTLCEIHFEQGKLRNKKIAVPESLKIQKGDVGDGVEKRLKRKRVLDSLENDTGKGKKRKKSELIRVFLKREILEKKKKKKGVVNNGNTGEITKDLPYGLMEIPAAHPAQILENGGSLDIKVGVNVVNSLGQRRFRSKNAQPPPVGPLKVVPFAGNVSKAKNVGRKKCHWCGNKDKSSLTKCFTCKNRFFCAGCMKERDTDPEQVKFKCPACHGTCDCKACSMAQTKDVSPKEISKATPQGSKYQQLQYLIKLLLPILEQINQEQSIETETEARFKGQDLSEVEIRQADVGCRDKCCCNNCKSPILDFHRSCPNCSYNLCLSCCREYSQGGCLQDTEKSCSRSHSTLLPGLRIRSEKTHTSTPSHGTANAELSAAAAASPPESTACLHISCPPMELGGCDNSLLDLRCIFPLNWTKELEISATETASGQEVAQTTDNSLHCSSCASISQASVSSKVILEASRRKKSHDNFIYCPSSFDDHHTVLAHFQKHWNRGHPVKVQNALKCSEAFSCDPLAVFCSCLENNSNNCVNKDDSTEAVNCTDWYEVEIGLRELFSQSLDEGCTSRQHKTLRAKAKLSSSLSRTLLKDRYSEIIHALPLQEYTNPWSGLLNIAGKLPEDFPESKLGPHVCISFGSRDVVARGELVTKLHYNSYDVVDVLAHVADATCSKEQLNKISMLIRHNMKNKEDQSSGGRGQDGVPERGALSNGVIDASCCSLATNHISAANLQDDKSSAKLQSSDTDSDASGICSGTSDSPNMSIDLLSHLALLESSKAADKRPAGHCGAQWDVFRREDVPQLMEYITKHVEELSFSYDFPKNVVHPILDGSFYLDSTHKMQLKEEFDIEPWTFNQSLGEAVFIPAGCPYQTRNLKSCINITLGFISPENAPECIKLMNEIRTLPNNHKAKDLKLEVEKMAICSIDEAVNKIYRLRNEESILLDKGVQIPIPNN